MMTAKRTLQAADLLHYHFVSDPAPHPTGEYIAYVDRWIDPDRNEYRSQLCRVSADGKSSVAALTYGEKDSSPVWSPDGTQLAFLRRGQIWLLPASGGEARPLTALTRDAASLAWSPDSDYLLFTSRISEDPARDGLSSEEEARLRQDRGRVISRTKPKAEGSGLWDDRYARLFTVQVSSGHVVQLTDGPFDVTAPIWSPDGRHIAFTAKIAQDGEDPDLLYLNDLYLIQRTGGELHKLTDSSLFILQAGFSPDGARLAFFAHDRSMYTATQTELYVIPLHVRGLTEELSIEETRGRETVRTEYTSSLTDRAVRLTRNFDAQLGHALLSDMRPSPPPAPPLFSPDGRDIYTLVSIRGSVLLYRFPADGIGEAEAVTAGERDVFQFALTADGCYAVVASSDALRPGDLYRIDLQTKEEIRLTASNDALLERLELSRPESFDIETDEGFTVQGWIMPPAKVSSDEIYPAILQIHGGPHAMYGNTFAHEFQALAALGYAVIYLNPRGSFGYGQAFVNGCRGDFGGGDYRDLLAGLEAVLARFPYLDPARLGVAGGSYGGYMTNWIVSHTDRFRAAVSERTISNWLSMYGVSDIGYLYIEGELGYNPWDDAEKLWQLSPLAHVRNVNTPLLILHGEDDLRCPIEQAEQLYTALKRLGKRTRLVRFPGSNHDLSRSGKPSLRVERVERIAEWFGAHMTGEALAAESRLEE